MEDIWVWLYDREGPLGHKRPACMLLFAFLRGCFSIHCHSANEEGVPVPSKPLMAQGQNNRRLARCKAHFDLCRVDLVFRMSRASLLARLPLYCSAECATPTNSSLFANFSRNMANAPLPPGRPPRQTYRDYGEKKRMVISSRKLRPRVRRLADYYRPLISSCPFFRV